MCTQIKKSPCTGNSLWWKYSTFCNKGLKAIYNIFEKCSSYEQQMVNFRSLPFVIVTIVSSDQNKEMKGKWASFYD